MTLLQIEVFLAVYELSSFTKAAEKLIMSQSAVSHSIAGLEEELGVTLFHRGKTGITISEAGKTILPHARELLQQQALIAQKAHSLLGLSVGTIRIGSFPSFTAKWLTAILSDFKGLYPKITVRMIEGNYDQIRDYVAEGIIDMGFTIDPANGLEFTTLMHDSLMVIVPENHSILQGSPVSLNVGDIAEEPFIKDTGCESYLKKLFGRYYNKVHIVYELQDTLSILSMVQAKLGVTILPEMSIPDYIQGIVPVKMTPPLNRDIGLAVRSKKSLSPAAHRFFNFVEQRFLP